MKAHPLWLAALLVASDTAELRFASVAAGEDFTCALSESGQPYCWGSGIIAGSRVDLPYPAVVGRDHPFLALTAGAEHACALDRFAWVSCWGYGPNGALGNTLDTSSVPWPVRTDMRFVAVSAGSERTCAVGQDGAVYCWGRFSVPTTAPGGRATLRATAIEGGVRFRAVAVGLTHACGIGVDNRVYCWGSNNYGERGGGPAGGPPTALPAPVLLAEERDTSFALISASVNQSCAVDRDGNGYCWGRNLFGEIGNGRASETDEPTTAPTSVAGDHRWRLIRSAGGVTCGLTVEGEAYCWGINLYPRTFGNAAAPERCDGPPPRGCSTRPMLISEGLRFRDLSVGRGHACAVTTGGKIYCWGDNDHGQLGNGSGEPAAEPTPVVLRP